MGFWSNKPFGNDTALDWFQELETSEQWQDKIRKTLDVQNCDITLDSNDAEQAVAAAAIVASAANIHYMADFHDANRWIECKAYSPDRTTKVLAINAIEKVIDSDLAGLHREAGTLSEWETEINCLLSSLHKHLDAPSTTVIKIKTPRSLKKLVEHYLSTNDNKLIDKIVHKLSYIKDPDAQDKFTDYDLPLNIAATSGIPSAVQLVLDKGADINARSRFGNTALTLSCLYGHLKTTRVLLENGAKLFEASPKYDTEGNLIGYRSICSAILCAARTGKAELLELLVHHGADLQETDLNGETLVHKAAEAGNSALLEFLIQSGLDINQRKGDEQDIQRAAETPLHYATNNGHLTTIAKLIELGADVNAVEYFKGNTHSWCNTPLDLVSNNDSEVYKYLLAKGGVKYTDLNDS